MSETNKVILDIIEKENAKLSGKGTLESIDINGNLTIVNPSNKNRIWNLVRVVDGLESTNLEERETKIGAVEAGGKNAVSYKVQEKDVTYKPLIALTETIDTYFEKGEDVNWNFVLNNRMPTMFTLKLTNTSPRPTTSCILKKKLPEVFDDPVIESTTSGNASYDAGSRTITWTDVTVPESGEQVLTLRAGANPTQVDPYPAGEIELDYEIVDVQKSKIDPSMTGVSESLFALEKTESQHTEWECIVEFQNMSDFQVSLGGISVMHAKESTKEVCVEETPNVMLNPSESWTKNFNVSDAKPPKLAKSNKFTILTETHRKVIGHVEKRSDAIPVGAIQAVKVLQPQQVPAHAKTDITVEEKITNTGSAPLSSVYLKDIIPASFKPPSLDKIEASIGGQPLRQNLELEMDPPDENPDVQHELVMKIPDLEKVRGPLGPGEVLIIKYPLKAWDPKPANYPCVLEADLNVSPPGQPVKSSTPDSQFLAMQVKRSYRAFKQVQPGAEEGEYAINVVFQNKGEVPVQKCKVTEVVPQGFVFVSSTPEDIPPETADSEAGTKVTWNLANVEPGSQVTISYNIKGSGDYFEEDPEIEFD